MIFSCRSRQSIENINKHTQHKHCCLGNQVVMFLLLNRIEVPTSNKLQQCLFVVRMKIRKRKLNCDEQECYFLDKIYVLVITISRSVSAHLYHYTLHK